MRSRNSIWERVIGLGQNNEYVSNPFTHNYIITYVTFMYGYLGVENSVCFQDWLFSAMHLFGGCLLRISGLLLLQ